MSWSKAAWEVVLRGQEIPYELRRLGREDLAQKAEALPDLNCRKVTVLIGFGPKGPMLLDDAPLFNVEAHA